MSSRMDPRFLAAWMLLSSPTVAGRFEGFVDLDSESVDWAGINASAGPLSGAERVVVRTARNLCVGRGSVDLADVADRLDDATFRRVVAALVARRGLLRIVLDVAEELRLSKELQARRSQ